MIFIFFFPLSAMFAQLDSRINTNKNPKQQIQQIQPKLTLLPFKYSFVYYVSCLRFFLNILNCLFSFYLCFILCVSLFANKDTQLTRTIVCVACMCFILFTMCFILCVSLICNIPQHNIQYNWLYFLLVFHSNYIYKLSIYCLFYLVLFY